MFFRFRESEKSNYFKELNFFILQKKAFQNSGKLLNLGIHPVDCFYLIFDKLYRILSKLCGDSGHVKSFCQA